MASIARARFFNSAFKKALFILVLASVQASVQASTQTKPSNANDIEDPFDNTPLEEPSLLTSQNRLFYYQQYNQASEGEDFSTGQLALDLQVQTSQGKNWQVLTRVVATDNNHDDAQTHVLEAYGSWSSESRRYGLKAGRIKPQWSNGYNWNLANLLRPYQDRPYLDVDNLEQLKGWDLIAANFNYGPWQMAGYVVDLSRPGQSATTQQVLRMAYTGNIDGSWLVYQVPGSKPSWAANMSSLFGDHWLIRTEASVEQNREKSSTPLTENQSEYIKWVVGLAYQSINSGLASVEYLYNQHGYNEAEWAFIEELILDGSESTSQSQQAVGQLRKHYLYLQYLSEESWDLWQYRQSVQLNLDDDSQLHRLEVNKGFNDELSARLQIEYFTGCDTCEYGLAGLTMASRLAIYWSF